MKSGEAHCDQELADEIRRGGGRTRKDEEGRDGEEGGRRKDEEGELVRGAAHLTTLTWQVGNNIWRCSIFLDIHQHFSKGCKSISGPAGALRARMILPAWRLHIVPNCEVRAGAERIGPQC